jgi:hypothetical protein
MKVDTVTTRRRSAKMETITSKLIATGILFLLTLISGVILSRSGRPLNVGFVTIHKLIAVGTVVLIGMIVNQLLKDVDGKLVVEISAIVISGILFLGMIATGALLTREEMRLPELVLKFHQVAPLLALASSAIAVYLLASGKS